MFCNKCGTSNAPAALFCTGCGASMNPAVATAPAGTVTYPAQPLGYAQGALAVPPIASIHYAGFWIRVVAAIIDAVLIGIVIFPLAAVLGLGGLAAGRISHTGPALPLLGFAALRLVSLFGGWLYGALMESSSHQATLGKMIFGLKVTDLEGNRISFGRATGRHFAKYVSAMILGIGFIMAGFTERKQGLHDMLAGTLVRWS